MNIAHSNSLTRLLDDRSDNEMSGCVSRCAAIHDLRTLRISRPPRRSIVSQSTAADALPFHQRTQGSTGQRPFANAVSGAELGAEPALDAPRSADPPSNAKRRVVLLFKHDLRLDDHPGLHRTVQCGDTVIPLYVLDPALLHPYLSIPAGVELLHGALQCLRASLQSLHSDLVLRTGSFGKTLAHNLRMLGAGNVLTEAEADIRWRSGLEDCALLAPEITLEEWTCSMYSTADYSQDFRRMGRKLPLLDPLRPLDVIPSLPAEIDPGELPDVESLRELLIEAAASTIRNGTSDRDPFLREAADPWIDWSAMLTASSHSSQQLLQKYLSCVPLNGEKENGVMEKLIRQTEDTSFPGISFSSMFSSAISLGLLSPRRIAHAVKDAGSQWGSRPFLLAAQLACQSYDFHANLAQKILLYGCDGTPGTSVKKFWKWQGILSEYSVALGSAPDKGAVVLVHGFGASCMHWRRNVDALTAQGYTVYCPSLPGYGRTQKLPMKYSQVLWTEFLNAFIAEIVGEPVVLAGNSIGAFVATQAAAARPDTVNGLVLINPAGPLVEDFIPSDETQAEPVLKWKLPAFIVDGLSRALLFYLEKSAGQILKSVYPVCEQNADEAFLREILRAAADPNALAVVKSVFFLKKPEPLNYLLSVKYQKPVLLLQGALDPLNDAVTRATRIGALCPNVRVKVLQAGHCGHDETPEAVNESLREFLFSLHEHTALVT